MTLDFDVQLQVALRALNEVIAPALGGAEKHVVEQLHLAVATIGFVKARLPDARRYHRMELHHFVALAKDASGLVEGDAALDALVVEGGKALASPTADLAEYHAINRRLRDAVTALVSRSAGTDRSDMLDRLVIERSGELFPQYRRWAEPFGFELQPDALPAPAW